MTVRFCDHPPSGSHPELWEYLAAATGPSRRGQANEIPSQLTSKCRGYSMHDMPTPLASRSSAAKKAVEPNGDGIVLALQRQKGTA